MIHLGLQRNWGDINAFVMTGFRERTFPGRDGRLRGGAVVDTDEAVYESSAEEWHVDFALRYTLNDVNDTDLLAGFFIDRDSGGSIINVEADTRLSDHWTIEVEARAFADIPRDDPGFGVRDDHQLQIRLARHL